MTKKMETISCPHCNKSINVGEIIAHRVKEQTDSEVSAKRLEFKSQLNQKDKELQNLQESITEKIAKETEKVKKETLEKAKHKAQEEVSIELKDLQEQVETKGKKIDTLEKEQLDLRKNRRDLEHDKESWELKQQKFEDELKKQYKQQIVDEKKQIYRKAQEKTDGEFQFKLDGKNRLIDGLKKQLTDANRKLEQGSQEAQGEVLEEHLQKVLKAAFVSDEVKEISKGQRGADILQSVCRKSGKHCGKILIEAKNTKDWGKSWITKLRKDQRNEKAAIGIIISTVLPKGVSDFGLIDGVWICQPKFAISVIIMLRQQIEKVADERNFNAVTNDKKEALYKYLTSVEFSQKVESVLEPIAQMHDDLGKERTVMEKHWAKREKTIQQTRLGIAGMFGDMQGILPGSLPEIKSLSMSGNLIGNGTSKKGVMS